MWLLSNLSGEGYKNYPKEGQRQPHILSHLFSVFSRPYLSNGRTIGMVVVVCVSVCTSVTDVAYCG